jgi:Uma2 family endonuclease
MTPTAAGLDKAWLQALYESTEREFFDSLPLEHFMESVPHATQRKITLESFDQVHIDRPDIQCFNELLIQYPLPGRPLEKPGQVVPDNMVVLHPDPIEAKGSFTTLLQPAVPFLVLEYVSPTSAKKDYEDNREKYEKELKAPYYLLFDPEPVELILYQMVGGRYQPVRPNAAGRFPIPEMELEVALHEDWVRYWFRGRLVPLTPDLKVELDSTRDERDAARSERDAARIELQAVKSQLHEQTEALTTERQSLEAERLARLAAEAELAKLREDLARLRQP